MKKTVAILLLVILAFNWVGYRFVSGLLERKADVAFASKIDRAEYKDSDLAQITIPLNAPYLSGNSSGFERYDGEVELDGVHYRYVKRKIVDGNLVLLCLPNESKKHIQNSRMDFFKLVNDLNHSTQGKEKNTTSVKAFAAEYKQESNSWNIIALAATHQHDIAAGVFYHTRGFDSVLKQPPRA